MKQEEKELKRIERMMPPKGEIDFNEDTPEVHEAVIIIALLGFGAVALLLQIAKLIINAFIA